MTALGLLLLSIAFSAMIAWGAAYRAASLPSMLTTEHDEFDIQKRMPSPFRGWWWFLALISGCVVSASALTESEGVALVLLGAGNIPIAVFSFIRAFRDARVAARELGID